ncbi:MAG: helix-turn-helix domain-containing protein [Betaproteobacteria bacterium]|nr:helix-turn-helix domain-containing protein [Betaproteobacteria bacterium]MCL2886631.1 helix-turn-helix domain-containing protein [Betaproteobacteria bacterium]
MSIRLTDFFVRFPIFGTIAKNSKNFERGRDGWMNAEEKLCIAYKKYMTQRSKDEFLNRIEYMKHAGDLGRTPVGTGFKIFLFLLVAAESMGFSYLLGTWIASEGSANLYTQLMYGIVFVLASILAFVTHQAGEEFYRTRLKRSCHARYKERGNTDFPSPQVISLSENQFSDKSDPPETRCMNRIIANPHDRGSYFWSWVAGAFVVAIFVASGVMRYKHMDRELTLESQAAQATASNPFAQSAMPSELKAPQAAADKRATEEVLASTKIEGGAAIFILGVIFVVTQIVGFGTGYKHCFAGRETYKKAEGKNSFWWWSEKDGAYADTWGYSTYEAYWEAMQPWKDIVNARLKELQRRLNKNSPNNLKLTHTFDDFLAMEARKTKESQNAHNNQPPLQGSSQTPRSEPAAVIPNAENVKPDMLAIAAKTISPQDSDVPKKPEPPPAATAPGLQIMTVAQAAQLLDASETDVLAEIEAGRLRARKIGSQWRIAQDAVDEFMRG